MRQIFSSQRVENVETLAQVMREQGIEVQITNGRSYRGNRRRTFSYNNTASARSLPSLWVVRSDDQPRARQLMREMGVPGGPTTRPMSNYMDASTAPSLAPDKPARPPAFQRIMRYRRLLLVAIAILAALVMVRSL